MSGKVFYAADCIVIGGGRSVPPAFMVLGIVQAQGTALVSTSFLFGRIFFTGVTARIFFGFFSLYSQWIKNLQDSGERKLSKYVLKTTSFFSLYRNLC